MTSEPSQRCRVVSWDQIGWLLSEEELLPRLSAHSQRRHTVTRASCQHPARQRSRHPPLSELLELRAVTGNWPRMWGALLQWQDQGCPPPGQVGSDSGKDQTGTLALSGVTSVFLNVFFPFEICTHSGTVSPTDTGVPACHPHSMPFPTSITWGFFHCIRGKWTTQRIRGSFSDLRRSSRVSMFFLKPSSSSDFNKIFPDFLFNFSFLPLSSGHEDSSLF